MRTMMRSASWLFEALAGLTSVLVRLPAADVGRTKCRAVGRAMGLTVGSALGIPRESEQQGCLDEGHGGNPDLGRLARDGLGAAPAHGGSTDKERD